MSTKKSKSEVATKGTGSGMVTFAQMGQEGIPHMLEMVKAKIKAITRDSVQEESTKGKCLPGFTEIAKIDKVTTLIQAHSSVVGKANAYKASAKALGMDIVKFPFKLEGCTERQWVEDIQARAIVLANQKELDKLKATQKLLEENLSQEEKLKNDLAKVAEMFNDETPLE